jgi:guanylate kinase
MLRQEFSCVVESISYTTRRPRSGERDGIDYFFINTQEFEKKIAEGEFLEYARVFDHYYGTSREFVEKEQDRGKHVILVIDTQGAMQLMGSYGASFIFISPPSLMELKHRLVSRKADPPDSIEKRLSWAAKEMSLASKYDYHIVNDDLTVAYAVLKSILVAEEHRNR